MKSLIPVLALILFLLIFFLPSLTGGTFIASGMLFSDLMLFNYPLKAWYREMLLTGQLPFWTNLVGNGYPVFAEGQIGALYPPHLILFWLFPTLLAFNLNIFFHFLAAALFTYLFCRKTLGTSKAAGVLAGLTYSMSGFFMVHIPQVNIPMLNAYLPLDLFMIGRLARKPKSFDAFLFALILALQFHAGHVEMLYYNIFLSGLFLLSILVFGGGVSKLNRVLVLLLATGILFGGMSAVQALPTWELTKYSNRSEGVSFEVATNTLWPLKTFILFVNPRAFDVYRPDMPSQMISGATAVIFALYGYVGILPLTLAFLAIFKAFRKPYVLIFILLLVFSLLWGVGRSTQLYALLWETVPGMRFFRYPVKILFFIEFCLAILAAFGLDYLVNFLTEKKKTLGQYLPILTTTIILMVFIDLYINNGLNLQPIISGRDWFATPKTASFLQEELKKEFFRIYSHGSNNLDYRLARNVLMQKEFQNLLFIDFNMAYKIPANREWFVLLLDRQTKLNQYNAKLDLEEVSLTLPPPLKKSLSLQTVKFLLSDLPIEDQDLVLREKIPFSQTVDHFAYLATAEGVKLQTVPASAVYVYENTKVYPHLIFVNRARVLPPDLVLETILEGDFDPRKEVILEEGNDSRQQEAPGFAETEIIKYEDNRVEIKAKVEGKGYLVLADTFFPGWKAYVDGRETKIQRANWTFRAIPISEGDHRVLLTFEPTHFRIGAAISLFSLSLTLLGLVVSGSGTLLAKKGK